MHHIFTAQFLVIECHRNRKNAGLQNVFLKFIQNNSFPQASLLKQGSLTLKKKQKCQENQELLTLPPGKLLKTCQVFTTSFARLRFQLRRGAASVNHFRPLHALAKEPRLFSKNLVCDDERPQDERELMKGNKGKKEEMVDVEIWVRTYKFFDRISACNDSC